MNREYYRKIKKRQNKLNIATLVLIILTIIMIIILIFDNLDMWDEKKDEDVMTCDERTKTNQYLIKICKESGSDVKITYFQDGKTIQSISCGGKE